MTESNNVVSIQDRIDSLDRKEVDAMKSVMEAITKAEQEGPGAKVNDIVNDLVEFMMMLTQSDCETFARSIRKVTDAVSDARSTHKDEPTNYFAAKSDEDLTPHQKLVREMQRTRDIVSPTNTLMGDIHKAMFDAGFSPRVQEVKKETVEEILAPLEIVEQLVEATIVNDGTGSKVDMSFDARISTLEDKLSIELKSIKEMLENIKKS